MAHMGLGSCQRISRIGIGALFRTQPLQGAIQLPQQLVELRLRFFGKYGHQLVHEVLVGWYNFLKQLPPLLGEVETVGPSLLAPRDEPPPLHLVDQVADVALGDE